MTEKKPILGSFFDTNQLLCLPSGTGAKADRAKQSVGNGGMISVHFAISVTTHKACLGLNVAYDLW